MKFELTLEEYGTIQAALTDECCHMLDKIREAVMKDKLDEDLIIELGEILKADRQVLVKLYSQYEAQEKEE